MNDTLDVISKLMALALNNPDEEEARSAALKAVKLIEKYKVPVGDVIPEKVKEWTAPSEDFYRTVEEIFKGGRRGGGKTYEQEQQRGARVDDYEKTTVAEGEQTGMRITDRELSDESPLRRQIILAWRAIRDARAKLEMEWQHLNKHKFGRDTGYRG